MTTLRRRYHDTPDATINITPLVDGMLVLMILFLIATPVLANQLPIDLPQPNERPPAERPIVRVRLEAHGETSWDDRVLPRDALAAPIAYESARIPQPVVEVDARDDVAYADVIALAKQLDRAGIDAVTFKPRR